MTTSRISICIPTYNGDKYLAESIESARAQIGDDIEILISDDGSSDGTISIVNQQAAEDPRIRVLRSEKNRGLVGNWNNCIDQAKGEWIKFLFQDDLLFPEYMPRMRPYLEDKCPFIVSHRDFRIEPGTPEKFAKCYENLLNLTDLASQEQVLTPEDFSWILVNFPNHNFIGEPSNTMFRRSIVQETGFFNAGMSQIVDLEFWARLGCRFGLVHIPDTLSLFRVHSSSTSSKNYTIRNFRTTVLDTLILFHDYCFAPHFSKFRAAAQLSQISPQAYLISYVNNSEKRIIALEKSDLGAHVLEEEVYRPWGKCCLAYPMLWTVVKSSLPYRARILSGLFPGELV
ncbi:MAG: glycosyltransferase [Chitinispirillaceae bacterium]|nr:glycosyltransferase [Chitinispirillaceae bacterium]